MEPTILVKIEDRVATVTINRPQESNSFGETTCEEITAALKELGENEQVGAIVVTGAGKNFCAGGNIRDMKERVDRGVRMVKSRVELTGKMAMVCRQCPKPVIAMVNGAAAGAGAGLVLACDFRILTPRSKLIMAFINLGLPTDTAGMYLLVKMLGTAKAGELMMLGQPIKAEQADKLGLVSKLVEEEELESATYELARKLASGPAVGYATQKALMNKFFFADMADFVDAESQGMEDCSRTDDYAEAVTAFMEKRPPVYQGK